jgi:hypothetical protein
MWYMHPITVSIDVPQSREDVYAYLDVLANHRRFTDHMMRNWRLEGPERGVGGKARVDAVVGGRTDPIEIEVIEAEPPLRNVERNVGANGRRVGTGTYTLEELADGSTRVTFEYAWQLVPLSERLLAPLVSRTMRRALTTAMERLAGQLRADPVVSRGTTPG